MVLGMKSFIGTRSSSASECQRSPSASKYASLVTANCAGGTGGQGARRSAISAQSRRDLRLGVERYEPRRRRDAAAAQEDGHLPQPQRHAGALRRVHVENLAVIGERRAGGVVQHVRQHERPVEHRCPRGGVAHRNELVTQPKLRRVDQEALGVRG